MKFLTFNLALVILLNSPLVISSETQGLSYVVRKGDTLSEVLSWLGICPVWGENNVIPETVKLNKNLVRRNGHLIVPKKQIRLPVHELVPHDDYSVSESGIVAFVNPKPSYKCHGPFKNTPSITKTAPFVVEKPLAIEGSPVESVPERIPATEDSPPVTKSQEDEDDDSYGILRMERDSFYSSLDLTDRLTGDSAQLLSSINNSTRFFWDQVWDEENKSFLFYRSGTQDYEAFTTKFSGKKISLQGFGIGYERKITQDFSFSLSAQAEDKPFLRALTVSSLVMERAMVPSLELRPKYRLASRKKFSLFAEGNLSYLLPSETSNYKIESGLRMGAGLAIVQKIKDFEIKGAGFYNVESQHSKIMKKEVKELGISIGLSWSFGK